MPSTGNVDQHRSTIPLNDNESPRTTKLHKGPSKIKFAPISTPLRRRKETAVVLWHILCIPIFITLFFILLAVPLFWIFVFPYSLYLLIDRSATNGKVTTRYSEYFRNLQIWKHFCNYFPIKIHKTQNLQPTFTDVEVNDEFYSIPLLNYIYKFKKKPYIKKVKTGPAYIFGLHPHGVAAMGAFGALATEGANWSKLFPGVPVCLLTLLNQFYVPLNRDYLFAFGITSAARTNALKILQQGYSLGIVVGGAQESLFARPGSNDIVLRKRKGFIKLALETGNVGLVPSYCFGETDLFEIVEPEAESFGRKLQHWLKQNFGFTLPFFYARGVFNYDFGFLPYRRPVNIVTGRPIIVPYMPSPTRKEVDHYHNLYIEELQKVFNEHKSKFIENGQDVELNIAE